MAAHNPQSRSNFPTPVAYPPQVPQQKPVRVDPSAPLPKSFAPIQNPDHAAWPEEVQRNSVSTPEPPKDESVRATSKKRRVSGTGRGPRNSQGASYPQPPAPEVPHALSVPFQGPYVPNGTAPQSSDPTSFAARAHGFSDSEDYPPIDVHAEPEPSPALEKLRRRRSRRRSHHSTDTQELGSHSRPEVAQPSSARSGVPVQQPRLVDIPAQRRVVEHGSVPQKNLQGKQSLRTTQGLRKFARTPGDLQPVKLTHEENGRQTAHHCRSSKSSSMISAKKKREHVSKRPNSG